MRASHVGRYWIWLFLFIYISIAAAMSRLCTYYWVIGALGSSSCLFICARYKSGGQDRVGRMLPPLRTTANRLFITTIKRNRPRLTNHTVDDTAPSNGCPSSSCHVAQIYENLERNIISSIFRHFVFEERSPTKSDLTHFLLPVFL